MSNEIHFLEQQKEHFEGEDLKIIESIIHKLQRQIDSDMEKMKLTDFLNHPERKNFYIPLYQREYRWGTEEIRDFLDDLISCYATNTEPSLGIFYVSHKGEDKLEVVDGQQRITTLILFLKAMQVKGNMPELNKQFLDALFVKGNLIVEAQNEELNDHYHSIFFNPDVKEKSNIHKAYQIIEKEFATNNNQIRAVAKHVLEKLTFQLYTIGIDRGNDKAYTYDLFLKLNARGTPLSYIDLIKTHLYKEKQKDGENFQLFLTKLKNNLSQINEDKKYDELEIIFRNYLKAFHIDNKDITLRKEYRSFMQVFEQWGSNFKPKYKEMCSFMKENSKLRKTKTMNNFANNKDHFLVFHYGLTQHFKIEEFAPLITRTKLDDNYDWARALFLISIEKKLDYILNFEEVYKVEKFNNRVLNYKTILRGYNDEEKKIPNVDVEVILGKWTKLEQRMIREKTADTSPQKEKQLSVFSSEWKIYIEGLKINDKN